MTLAPTGTAEGRRPSPAAAEGGGGLHGHPSSPNAHLPARRTSASSGRLRGGGGTRCTRGRLDGACHAERTRIGYGRAGGPDGRSLYCIAARWAASQASHRIAARAARLRCPIRRARTAPHGTKGPRTARTGLRTQGARRGSQDSLHRGQAAARRGRMHSSYRAGPRRATRARSDPPPPRPPPHVPRSALRASPCIAASYCGA